MNKLNQFIELRLSLVVVLLFSVTGIGYATEAVDSGLKVAVFDVDATPPIGDEMSYNPVKRHDELTLRSRGIVILGSGLPIVLCAVDWLAISNETHEVYREDIAKAAGTKPERVTVHALHQHDAPRADFTAEKLVKELGLSKLGPSESTFHREVLRRTAMAVSEAIPRAQPVTHYAVGTALVENIASNRRIMGVNGLVRKMRYTATRDPELRAEPVGVIDPELSLLSFWNKDRPVASLTYYACHPQSYYRTGVPSVDFPGIARFIRGQDEPKALHVHFTGAGGNIGAGKYNDGSTGNRMKLATRLANAMREAWESSDKFPLTTKDAGWKSVNVQLPISEFINECDLIELAKEVDGYSNPINRLAWLHRNKEGHGIEIGCLSIGKARVLHMPGELFVEYQLAAKEMRKDLTVMMAAYGDRGPGYIGTAISYKEGGYESSPTASFVGLGSEEILMGAVEKLLEE